jgi:hypothetical protein
MLLAWAIGAGCGLVSERGDAPVLPPAEAYVEAPDQVLPGGVVGERYTAAVTAEGGTPPYTWLAADPLPSGLALAADGTLTGVPTEAGTRTFALVATDADGRTKRMLATFTAALVPVVTTCGGHLEGRFDESIWGDDGPDLGRLDDLAWLAIEVSRDGPTRIELVFSVTGDAVAWVQRVDGLLGSWDLQGYAQRGLPVDESPRTVAIDAGTDPSLTEYAVQTLLPVLLAAKGPGNWALDVVCTDGPVFETLDKNPRLVGDAFEHDYQVFGDNTGVRIWTDDVLPDWMVWDESTGTVTAVDGVAAEAGAWEFDLHARSPDGRERVERAMLSAYTTTDLPCGTSAPVVLQEAWEEGEQVRRFDPRGFQVFRVPLGVPEVSGLDIRLRGAEGNYLGLARPNPGWQRISGQAEEVQAEGSAARLRVDSTTYPSSRHFLDTGELWFTAASLGEGDLDGLEVDVRCEYDPRPDVRGLPILEVLEAVDLTLGGIGGTPPYRWSASGLPAGLSLSERGHVTGTTGDVGRHRVTFGLTDSLGQRGEQVLTWVVGTANTCLGYRVLGCGEGTDGVLVAEAPAGGEDARDTFCVMDTSVDLGFVVGAEDAELVVSLSDPGVTRKSQLDDPSRFTWVAEVERGQVVGVPFDAYSFPYRPDYDQLPLFVTVWALDPGGYSLSVDCPVFP